MNDTATPEARKPEAGKAEAGKPETGTPVSRRRTFAIISHPDAGKTTLTEKLLLFGGAIQLAGEVQGQEERRADPLRLDGHRARARHLGRHLGDDLRVRRLRLQPARHAGPRGLLGGHLPHADRRRLRRHGDRRGQGHRGAHAQAVRGLPPARHPDRHLHQQDGPRERATRSTCSTRSRRRWRSTPRRSPGRSAAAAASPAPTTSRRTSCAGSTTTRRPSR